MYRDWFGLSVSHLCLIHRYDTRFPTTPHSDIINHDGSVWDSESKLLEITRRRKTKERRCHIREGQRNVERLRLEEH